jgi:hypothetical protein
MRVWCHSHSLASHLHRCDATIGVLVAYTCSAPQPASASLRDVNICRQVVLPCILHRNNVPHVGGWLNGGNEFERNIDEADKRNDAGGDVVIPVCTTQNAADEEVDCVATC